MESSLRLNMYSQKLNNKQHRNNDGFGKLSMGNEMGNNNTSAIKEEDNLSEAEKKSFQEDTNETSIAKDVMEKASIDITNEPGKDTWQDEGHAEDVKGKTQTITTDEDTQEKTRVLENDSMEGDTHASDVNMENPTPPTAEAEGVQGKSAALVSEDATTELGKVTLQEDSHEDCVKENKQMIPTDEAKDFQEEEAKDFNEEVKGINSNNTESMLKKDLLAEDTCKNDMNMENKIHPTTEVEDVQVKATGMTSHSRSSLENDLLEGDASEDDVNVNHKKHQTVEDKFDQLPIEARLDFDDETSDFEDKLQEDKQDADVVNPTANGIDVQENTIISASDAPLKLTNSFEGSGDEITEVSQPEKSSSDGSESLSSFEGTEEYEKQETCLREHLLVTCNHHLNNEPSMQQGDEITEVRQPEKCPNDRTVEAEGGNSESLSSFSLEDTEEYEKQEETCVREHMFVTENHDLNNEPSIQHGDETNDFRQPEKSPNDEIIEAKGGNSETLSCSSLEDAEEYEKQEKTWLREHLLVTYNHHLNNEPSIQQGDEVTEVGLPENSSNDGSVEAEGGNSESLSSSSLEGTEEYEKQEESCLREHILVTYNHHLNNEPPIQQDEEETTVLTLSAVNMSNNIEIQESSVHSDHDEPDKFLSEQSFLGTNSLVEDNLLDANSHFEQLKDDGLAKEMESHVKLFTDESVGKDGNEFGSSLIDTSGTTSDSLSIDTTTNGNSLTKVNCTTEDSLTSPLEFSIVNSLLEFDHEENCKVLYGESILSRSGSIMENSHDYEPDPCMKDSLKEYNMVYTCDMTIGSNGDCDGERNMLLDSNVSRLVTNVQVEEPKLTEDGVPFDAYIINSNKASEESGAASPEAKRTSIIEGLTVVDCRHEKGASYKNKIEETNEKPEASHVMVITFEGIEMSEQCNCDLVTINQEESSALQNNSSLLHIYDDHQDNVKQDKIFTATSMPNLDWKQTNKTKNFGHTIDNLDSSKVTVPSLDLVDNEAFEKEGEEDPQHAEGSSSAGEELTTSTATMSIEPFPNKSIFENGGYETRDSVTRLSTESNPDNPNTSCQMQKSPSFKLNLRKEATPEETDKTPLLHQNKSANESFSKQTSLNLIHSMPQAQYEQCMLHSEEMPVEEKIVTMERSYSKKSKAPFIGLLKEEEEAHLLGMAQIQDNHVGTKNTVPSTSPKRKEKRKPRSSFFSSCMCCATVP